MNRAVRVFSIAGLLVLLFCFAVRTCDYHRRTDYLEQRLTAATNELDQAIARMQLLQSQICITGTFQGTASWYGPRFHGRMTANGELFDMFAYSLAHKTLPLGTWVIIRNETNGREAVGIINDRGPFIEGREFDLSFALAKKLGFEKTGLTRVTVRTLGVLNEDF